jgi:co-chaperonin GroES (HSP10)
MNNILPIGDRILIKQRVEKEEVSQFGIIVAPNEVKKYPIGKIIALGTGEKISALTMGEEILFDEWGGTKLDKDLVGEEDLIIIGFEKIIAKVCPKN